MVASNDNAAADGRNATLTYMATVEGLYRARVVAQDDEGGEYVLRLDGVLRDTDGDGVFDQQFLFADRMMFPEGRSEEQRCSVAHSHPT